MARSLDGAFAVFTGLTKKKALGKSVRSRVRMP